MVDKTHIRNFSIIAHVDHGKSTLADRFLEITGTVPKDKLKPQLLDSLALERERGITIKLAPVRMNYTLPFGFAQGGNAITYTLNLIDTPGHVDFSYEVSRSLAAVEGAVLLVDATQGIQAQTLAHGLSAIEQKLTLITVINKIDLPNADVEGAKKQLVETFGFSSDEILLASGKTGEGVPEILKRIVEKVPKPTGDSTKPFRCLIFNSFFDPYKGVVAQVRVMDGKTPQKQARIVFLGTKAVGQMLEVGFFKPELTPVADGLAAGDIGYIATGIKTPDIVHVGDTIAASFDVSPLPGYKKVKPMVYVGFYPIDNDTYLDFKDALSKFKLNDPAFSYQPEQSQALGAGFRCGFLGLLHAEVVQERLTKEFDIDLIATTPSVEYLLNGKPIDNPAELDPSASFNPTQDRRSEQNLEEPWVKVEIFVPQAYIGAVMELLQEKRGRFLNMGHFGMQAGLSYEMPLSEMITDFYDRLKSVSSGFASLDWEFLDYRTVDAVRVDILVSGEKVDALSTIVVREKAESLGRKLAEKLKEVLPRQNFEVPIQAAIGARIIARETLKAYRKDVTQKLYGGDRTRKDKLLEKQKKGKKKMKMVGRVEIPQEAFLSILKS